MTFEEVGSSVTTFGLQSPVTHSKVKKITKKSAMQIQTSTLKPKNCKEARNGPSDGTGAFSSGRVAIYFHLEVSSSRQRHLCLTELSPLRIGTARKIIFLPRIGNVASL